MKNGVTAFPGWTYGSEVQPGGMVDTITGTEAPRFPITNAKTQSVAWINADGLVRYYFARDPKFDPLQFSPEKFAGRIKEIS
jgi:feruloyl esterase